MDEFEVLLAEIACAGCTDDLGSFADAVVCRLEALATDGEAWAERRLAMFAHDGARRAIKAWYDSEKSRFLSPNGKELTATKTYATSVRDPETGARTGRSVEKQLTLFTWQQIHEKRNGLDLLRAQLTEKIAILDLLIALERLYPAADTPYDAMLLHGIEPDQAVINLSKVV